MRLRGYSTSQIINHFTSKKIPVLSVHDSYIIAADKDHELTEAMDKAASRVVGKKVNLETEGFGYGSLQAMTNLDGTDQLTKLTRLEALRSKESEVVRTNEYSQRVKDWMIRNR